MCAWHELRDRVLGLATSIRRQDGTGDHVAINYKLRPREIGQILHDADVSQVRASSTIGAELTPVTIRPTEAPPGWG